MSLLKLFKKPSLKPLPKFDSIDLEDIPAASLLLFYGGTKITELVGNRLYGHPFHPAAFHAAFFIQDGLFLNVGAFKTIQLIKDEYRSTRRIDVISDLSLLPQERKQLCLAATQDVDKPKIGLNLPTYSVFDFLRFGFKFLKPSKKDICSENCVEIFGTLGRKISNNKPVDTAPWDLFEYALDNPEFQVNTLWEGPDFVSKYGGKN